MYTKCKYESNADNKGSSIVMQDKGNLPECHISCFVVVVTVTRKN